MTDKEKEFIASLKALMVRYNVSLVTDIEDNELVWVFTGESVDLDIEQIHTEIINGKR